MFNIGTSCLVMAMDLWDLFDDSFHRIAKLHHIAAFKSRYCLFDNKVYWR